ncbi:MAG: methyltransferase domain-containing protein [Dehalococcoidia bacterium]|nr:methyltransferase domain-containing protein [Dehalococcoidia bacterium]
MNSDALKWQRTAEQYSGGRYMDPALAQHIRTTNLELVRHWVPPLENPRILKTDAFADATCPARAFSWFLHADGQLVCYDIAPGICAKGRSNARMFGRPDTTYVTSDARFLPFADDSFDLIVSDSTLDHFHTREEIVVALREHARVLKPGGTMIVTLDNPHNATEPLFRFWLRHHRAPYYIGETLTRSKLVQALEDTGLDVTDTTALLHYPRLITKSFLRFLRWTRSSKSDVIAVRLLDGVNTLERLPSRYLTGLFIAARAIKPQ